MKVKSFNFFYTYTWKFYIRALCVKNIVSLEKNRFHLFLLQLKNDTLYNSGATCHVMAQPCTALHCTTFEINIRWICNIHFRYINGNLFRVLGPTQTIDDLDLSESTLSDNNIPPGITVYLFSSIQFKSNLFFSILFYFTIRVLFFLFVVYGIRICWSKLVLNGTAKKK